MTDIIKLGIVLCIVSSVAAFGLSYTYQSTEPLIRENKRKATEEALRMVLPEAMTFEAVAVTATDPEIIALARQAGLGESKGTGTDPVELIFTVGLKPGFEQDMEPAGAALQVAPPGYSGGISMVVGMDMNGAVSAINVVSHTETAGLGSKMTEVNVEKATRLQQDNPRIEVRKPWFQEQYKGRRVSELYLAMLQVPERVQGLLKDSAGEGAPRGTIDAITGATITSQAATVGVRDACVLWLNLKDEVVAQLSASPPPQAQRNE